MSFGGFLFFGFGGFSASLSAVLFFRSMFLVMGTQHINILQNYTDFFFWLDKNYSDFNEQY